MADIDANGPRDGQRQILRALSKGHPKHRREGVTGSGGQTKSARGKREPADACQAAPPAQALAPYQPDRERGPRNASDGTPSSGTAE